MVSFVPLQGKDNFQGVTTSTDLPNTSSILVEPFEEPDERVDESDPQQELYPHIGDEFRERVCRSDYDEVACGREGGKFDFQFATVRGLFDD